MASLLTTVALCSSWALGSTLLPRQSSSNTAVVDLSVNNGSPKHLASGVLYGIPDTPNQIPDSFYTDMGFNYARVGGAQLDAGGWIYGLNAYYARFNSTRNNYNTARKYGAPLISDLKANNMLNGLVWDIWNEPDGSFWARSQQQYLQLYVRTHRRLRQDSALNQVQISGPASASQPSSSNTWFKNWLSTVVQNNTIPDQYAWHDEPGDLKNDIPAFNALLKQYNAPARTININEYATFDQQNSAGAAWWISRLERYNAIGLRGNWLSGCQLHDFLASLLGKSNTNDCTGTGYYTNGEYQVYKYYNKNMTGTRAGTTTSGDGTLDVYTTIGSSTVRTLTGVLTSTGTWYINIKNLSSVGLPTSGSFTIQTWGFDDKGHFGRVDGPSNRGKQNPDAIRVSCY
ncbi:hypothetical protein PRZ48_013513 [Zasmidium cellare]|uniref:Glycoside hydrolase family 39 protein n=1 Tax=Zasmidium cellare TaxID=395010 RepID=A0ABR0E1S8_ZASCE|nr:hypothetical protein PRZ48_013513 [Zasmidium cellare]